MKQEESKKKNNGIEDVEHEDVKEEKNEELKEGTAIVVEGIKEEEEVTTSISPYARKKRIQQEFVEFQDSGGDITTRNPMDQIRFYWANGLLPDAIKTPEQAIIVYQRGQELKIPGVLACFDMIDVIGNKAGLNGKGFNYLIKRAGHGFRVIRNYEPVIETIDPRYNHAIGHYRGQFIYRNAEGEKDPNGELSVGSIKTTTLGFWRKGSEKDIDNWEFSNFNDTDAKTSGLIDTSTYKKYPKSMYFWKAITHGAKMYFGDVIQGFEMAEEPSDLADFANSMGFTERND